MMPKSYRIIQFKERDAKVAFEITGIQVDDTLYFDEEVFSQATLVQQDAYINAFKRFTQNSSEISKVALRNEMQELRDRLVQLEVAGKEPSSELNEGPELEHFSPPIELASWAYYVMPNEKLEDALANLEEAYCHRILPKICKGDLRKARKMFAVQLIWIVFGYHQNKFKFALALVAALMGFPQLAKKFKGFFS